MRSTRLLLLTLALGLAACGGDGAPAGPDAGPSPPTDAAADTPQGPDTVPPEDTGGEDAVPRQDTAPLEDTVPAEDTVPVDDTALPTDTPAEDAFDVPPDGSPDAGPRPPYTRPEQGDPVSAEELTAVTDLYLELLRETRWFAVTDERVHGWPRSDPAGGFWYGTWWSGVRILKEGGAVRYVHPDDGSDNNGMRGAPILASVCFAQALWGGQEPLLRKLVRGFEAWALAMERTSHPETGVMLSRAHYPHSIQSEDDGRSIWFDFDANRPGADWPGEDSPPSIYVHNPDNPWWGDVWVKNKRSKDDIGHMLQALAYLPACRAASADLEADVARVEAIYQAWSQRVEDDGWRIATVDEDWQTYFPNEDLAYFITFGGIECVLQLAVRLYGREAAGPLACGDGLHAADEQWALKNDFHQIHRSFHEAAAALAARAGDLDLADALRSGLAWRVERILDAREAGEDPAGPNDQDLAELIVMSANVGLPLTWREVRYLHDRIRDAHESYLTDGMRPHYHVFDPETPDGEYQFTPDSAGFFWRYLAAALGTCASPYVNPTSKPLLDCERVRAAAPW